MLIMKSVFAVTMIVYLPLLGCTSERLSAKTSITDDPVAFSESPECDDPSIVEAVTQYVDSSRRGEKHELEKIVEILSKKVDANEDLSMTKRVARKDSLSRPEHRKDETTPIKTKPDTGPIADYDDRILLSENPEIIRLSDMQIESYRVEQMGPGPGTCRVSARLVSQTNKSIAMIQDFYLQEKPASVWKIFKVRVVSGL